MVKRDATWMVLAVGAAVALGWLVSAAAQTTTTTTATIPAVTAAVESGAGQQHMTIRQIMHTGGGVMYVLAGFSFATVALVIYFFATLRVSQVVPRFLHRELVEKIRAGSLDDVRRACEYRPCPLSSIVLAAVDYVRNTPDVDKELLKDVMEGEGARQADSLQGQAQYLLDIAVLSPMLGLLGTVYGMLQAFDAVALEGAVGARPIQLAAGVSRALVATAFGLIVGIPAMGFYGVFRRKSAKVVSYLEVASVDVLTAFCGRRNK